MDKRKAIMNYQSKIKIRPSDIGIRFDAFARSLLDFICDEKIKNVMNFVSAMKLT